jgi:hypothetical protein
MKMFQTFIAGLVIAVLFAAAPITISAASAAYQQASKSCPEQLAEAKADKKDKPHPKPERTPTPSRPKPSKK